VGAKIGKLHYVIQNLHYYMDLYKPTLANLITKAFDENEVMYQATVTAKNVESFGTTTAAHLALMEEKVKWHQGHTYKLHSANQVAIGEYWTCIIPEMIWIFRMVKEGAWERREQVAEHILALPPLLMELVLMYYENCTYGMSKEVHSECVRLIDETKEKSRSSSEDKEGEGGSGETHDTIPSEGT
jgi:hypothetical protein